MNDSESALLQSSLALVKQRFQAIVGGSPSKAWLLQVHDRESGGTSPIYALADGYESPGVESKPSTWARLGCPAIGLGVPRFWRTVRLNGSEILTPIGKEAAELLMSLPVAVQSRLWRGLPAGTNLRTAEGDLLWALAVFELANANIAYSSLRAVRQTPLTEETAKAFFAPESKLPADSDWYATLPDFAAASVQAIDILQSWLADVAKQEAEEDGEPPETAETIQRRLQEVVKHWQEEHHLRVRLCMEAFPDLRTGLAKWEWDDHKGDCPEWQLANERLLKRFGAIDGEPARWGLRLRPPIMCVRWDEDAAIDLGRAIRDDLFDAARAASPAAPLSGGTPVEPQAETRASGDGQPQLKPCEGKAWSQHKEAVGKNTELATDRQAYDWFVDEIADDAGELPSFANWSRYLRAARKAMNQSKNGPRIGNETRSVVSVKRIERPRKRIEADR